MNLRKRLAAVLLTAALALSLAACARQNAEGNTTNTPTPIHLLPTATLPMT